jgi:hypothetical protein
MVNTTAASSAALHQLTNPFVHIGEGTLAALLFFCIPFRRRKWQSMLGLLLLIVVAAVATGCGGVTKSTEPTGNSGTTTGAYTITVTGSSGAMSSTTAVSLTVQ